MLGTRGKHKGVVRFMVRVNSHKWTATSAKEKGNGWEKVKKELKQRLWRNQDLSAGLTRKDMFLLKIG